MFIWICDYCGYRSQPTTFFSINAGWLTAKSGASSADQQICPACVELLKTNGVKDDAGTERNEQTGSKKKSSNTTRL